ncbi:hypothetical protein RI129_012551 [Pyrocoelia pectoralis]|uniref:G-protein coupled receptors family 1 profile domain-containing protein n=1 Tax=Pyrocoelia pectoralis TaxID=417401 RepID=A0AAN7ZF11_9COLE
MMLQYSNEQLATIIGVPIVTILLIWTVAIFHKNRKKWRSYDIAIVAILVQSILRNIAILAYTVLIIVKQSSLPPDYCKVVVWIFNSIHTFQASSLTTLAVIALFTVKLYRKQQSLQQYLTATHVIYHLFCLTTLCACVGVASILAQEDNTKPKNISFHFLTNENDVNCKFMPFELDVKFNIFIIVLHIFLAMVSLTAFIFICFNHLKIRRHGFDYLKKSTSDLSELSLSLTASVNENVTKNYYDTYTIPRLPHLDNSHNFDSSYENQVQNREPIWNSDLSNISMTVSSTNSKRPCLKKPLQDEEESGTGLYTMYPILTVCYLFNHIPLILICIFPRLVSPWPVSGVALWIGQLQDVLIPIGLGLADSRFCRWVSKVYKCTERCRDNEKMPPGVGLDGKFRPFGSQPQSLEITQSFPERIRPEPKFPITNGSLYTSIDGRLPIIHNYRRPKDKNGCIKTMVPNSLNVNLHSSHLRRQEYVRPRYSLPYIQPVMHETIPPRPTCEKCENHGSSQPCKTGIVIQPNIRRDVSFSKQRTAELRNRRQLHKRISLSEDSLYQLTVLDNMSPVLSKSEINRPRLVKNKRNKLGGRISKSQDCLNDLQVDLHKFRQNPESFQKKDPQELSCISSDDEYLTDSANLNDVSAEYDGTSQSSYSITTEANCDFDFYQSKAVDGMLLGKGRESTDDDLSSYVVFKGEQTSFRPIARKDPNSMEEILSKLKCSKVYGGGDLSQLRITRSNSKRSLESFQAYVEEENVVQKIQRSNSFMTVNEHDRNGRYGSRWKTPNGCNQQTYNVNSNIKYLQDVYNQNDSTEKQSNSTAYSFSVPDFKKIFISEYI